MKTARLVRILDISWIGFVYFLMICANIMFVSLIFFVLVFTFYIIGFATSFFGIEVDFVDLFFKWANHPQGGLSYSFIIVFLTIYSLLWDFIHHDKKFVGSN